MTKLKQFDLREKMKFFTGKSLEKTKGRAGLLFVLPFALGFLLIYLPIILDSICFSFFYIKNVRGGGYELIFKGFEYYNEALLGAGGSQFVQKLIAGLQQLVFDVPVILIFSLFIAVVLNQKMLGRAAFRAIFFIPVILSTGLMESINASNILSGYMGSEEGTATGSGESTSQQLVSAMDIQALFANMEVGAEIVMITYDLHATEYAKDNVMTEYEANFSSKGVPIKSAWVKFPKKESDEKETQDAT